VLSCDDLRAELSNLVDGELAPEVRRALEHHLAECRTCQVLYDSMKKTLTVVTEAGSFEVPESVADRIRSRVMADVRSRGAKPPENPAR
jgi:anti-sigma factor RsiW